MSKNIDIAINLPEDETSQVVCNFLESLDTPKSLTAYLLYVNREHEQLVHLECNPLHYTEKDVDRFRRDYAAVSLLAKADFLYTGIDTEAVAMKKFMEMEELCGRTNQNLRKFAGDGISPPNELDPLITRISKKISMILGEFDPENLLAQSDWGPGSTTLIKKLDASRPKKFDTETGVTRDLWPLVLSGFDLMYPLWSQCKKLRSRTKNTGFTIVRGNEVTTIPKNSKTDRAIAVEPGINLWFQKGVGQMIRRRLRLFGCNLNDQSLNQLMAARALQSKLVTVDFSSASDSIAFQVIKLLFPNRWFLVLDMLRSKYRVDEKGVSCFWKKFSSMGNGFTFELESLIFLSVALAVLDEWNETHQSDKQTKADISVYGDDVIMPQKLYPRFLEVTKKLGFMINETKSFSSGLFYESCGKHYFHNADVTPIYLKKRVDSVPALFKVHNAIKRLASRWCGGFGLDRRFFALSKKLVKVASSVHMKLYIPDGFGDGGLIENFETATPKLVCNEKAQFSSWEGYRIRQLHSTPRTEEYDGDGLLLDRLWAASEFNALDGIKITRTPNGVRVSLQEAAKLKIRKSLPSKFQALKGPGDYSIKRGIVKQWHNLGPWI